MIAMLTAMLAGLAMAGGTSGTLKMTGWLVYWDGSGSLAAFAKRAPLMDQVMAEAYVVTEAGDAVRRPLPTAEQRRETLRIAKEHNVKVFAMVSNYLTEKGGFVAEPVQAFLRTPDTRRAHAEALAKLAKEDGYHGIDLDYESLKEADRETFSAFVEEMARVARREKLLLSIAVHPKTEEPGTWDGPKAQDYARLGKAVDVFRIMTYDFSWAGSEAGPIAPIGWVEQVMAFAASVIPSSKLELGLPGYGYDWEGKQGRSITYADWRALLAKESGAVRHESGEMTLRYGSRTAFFADGESTRGKFAIARRLGLRGTALWRLGSEDPFTWEVFAQER